MLKMVKLIIISTKVCILHVILVLVFINIRNTKHVVCLYYGGQYYFIFFLNGSKN